MRRLILISFLLGAASVAYPATQPAPEVELVAVLDMRAVGATPAEASGATDRLREELLRSGKFKLINRDQMDEILKEQAFQQTGCTSEECAVQVGKVLGVRKMIAGRITKLDDRHWLLSASLLDVQTAQTLQVASVEFEGTIFVVLRNGTAELVQRLVGGNPSGSGAVTRSTQPAVTAPSDQKLAGSVREKQNALGVCFDRASKKYPAVLYILGILFVPSTFSTTSSENAEMDKCSFGQGLKEEDFEDARFVFSNRSQIMQDISRGQGERVASFVSRMGCPPEARPKIVSSLREHISDLNFEDTNVGDFIGKSNEYARTAISNTYKCKRIDPVG